MGRTKQTKRDSPTKKKGETKGTNEQKGYWQGKGKFQEKQDALCEKLGALQPDMSVFPWEEHPQWAIFNGMMGIYYGYFNDGDDAAGAIDNNRVHGPMGKSLGAFRDFVVDEMAVKDCDWILKYLDRGGEENLEKAMDQVVCWTELEV